MKTVFFDFGNVIGFFDHNRTVQKLLRFTSLSQPALFEALYGGDLETRYERGDISTEDYVRLAIEGGRLNCTPTEFLACFEDIFWPNPDVCDLIPKLKPRYRLGLASNTNDAHYTRYSAQFAETLTHFDALCPSHFARCRKPDAAYFAFCQHQAEAEPSECVFVDDLPENILAARSHGWKGVLYTPGTRLRDELETAGIHLG